MIIVSRAERTMPMAILCVAGLIVLSVTVIGKTTDTSTYNQQYVETILKDCEKAEKTACVLVAQPIPRTGQ